MKRNILAEMFVIVASYLMLTATVASAATLRTYSPTGVELGGAIDFSPGDLVEKSITVDPGSLMLRFMVSNATPSASVEGVWLYKCEDKNPQECMDSIFHVPDEFTITNVDASYAWSEVSAGSPETANMLYFVKLEKGDSTTWTAFWTEVTRDSPSSFTVTENDISEIGVYAEDISLISTIREFITTYSMIPANPAWLNKVVFQGASSVYEVSISGEVSFRSPSRPGSQEITGDEIDSVSGDYSFMLPVSGDIKSPVALFKNPSYTCGMFGCETDVGETSENCCYDCGCGSGYYCDSSGGCRPESGIGLSLFGRVSPKVLNCYESHVANIPVQIDNAPSGYSVSEEWCKLGGTFKACDCIGGASDVHACQVDVPPVDECGSGEFRISDNAIRLKIEYMDGNVDASKYVEAEFPDVTIGSFTCGQDGCETVLGEGWENCCYDCGCPSGYCNYLWGDDPGNADCSADPGASDFYTESMEPSHFYDHTPPDSVDMSIVLSNRPRELTVEDVSCNLECEYDGSVECDSSCSLTWSEAVSSDPGRLNVSARITFSVSQYNALRDYVLSPELTFDMRYRNGTEGYVYKSVTRAFNQISIGAHWCGDGNCNSETGETYSSCCFDCSCPGGQYCDTQSLGGPTDGDGCRIENFEFVLDSIGSLNLVDSSVDHKVPVLMHVENYPSGTTVEPQCYLAAGDVGCDIVCTPAQSEQPEDYNLSCTMNVPAIDYVTSPYYNSGTRKIRLPQNTLNITLFYNNGHRKEALALMQPMGVVAIDVTSHCGEGSGDPFTMCEEWLGEHEGNCCRDCGCGSFGDDYICYQGANLNGECLGSNTIDLRIEGFEPDPPHCVIGRFGGNCTYIWSHVANAHVVNSPPDLDVTKAGYSTDGNAFEDMNCLDTLIYGNWDCAFVPDDIEPDWDTTTNTTLYESDVEGDDTKTFYMQMGVRYELNGTHFVDTMSANASFVTNMTKTYYLLSCESEIERIEDMINDLTDNQDDYDDYGTLYLIMGVIQVLIGYMMIDAGMSTEPYGAALIILGILSVLMGGYQIYLGLTSDDTSTSLDTQIQQLNDLIDQKIDTCSSESFESTALAVEGIGGISSITY